MLASVVRTSRKLYKYEEHSRQTCSRAIPVVLSRATHDNHPMDQVLATRPVKRSIVQGGEMVAERLIPTR